jgi:hypothetical protein
VEGRGGGLTFEVIANGCVRLRNGGISRPSHVAGTAAVSEGVFADEDGSSRGGVGGVTPEVTGSGCNGLVVQWSLGTGGCAAAAIEDLPAGLLWRLLKAGSVVGGRGTSEVTAVAFDTLVAVQVEDLLAGLLWRLMVVGAGGDGGATRELAAAVELDGCGAAWIGELPAGLLWWLLLVAAGGGRSMPPLRGGN